MLGQKLTRGDQLLLALALFSLGILYAVYWGQDLRGNQATIFVGGKHWANVDLFENRVIEVKGKMGISQLRVEDGKIRFISSPCDTKRCIQSGWIRQSGEIVACVPNTVSVRILGPDPRFDTMNF